MASQQRAGTPAGSEAGDKPNSEYVDQLGVSGNKVDLVTASETIAAGQNLTLFQAVRAFPIATLLCFGAMTSALSDGFQFTLPGNIISTQGFIHQFGSPKTPGSSTYALNPHYVSLWGGMHTVAYMFALFTGTYPADKLGRKFMIALVQCLMGCACLCEMFATKPTHWIGAKILAGFSVGLNQSTLTTYVSELAPIRARGPLIGTYSFWWQLGVFLCGVTLRIVSQLPASHWRRAIYAEWALTGTVLTIWLFLPESPRWLCQKGKAERAKKILLRINGRVPGYDVEHEYAILEQEVEDGRRLANTVKEQSILDVFKGTNRRRTFISFFPFAWQQWIGNTLIQTYSSYFFQLAGLKQPFNGTVATLSIAVATNIFTLTVLIEKVGRRKLLLFGGTLCATCLFCVAAILKGVPNALNRTAVGTALIAICCIWQASNASSFGPAGYIYLGESSTPLLRAKTTGVAAGSTGFLNLIVNFCTPLMLASPKFGVWATALFYACTGLFGVIVVFFAIPEFKGRSYLELDELFERRIPTRQFASTKTKADLAREAAAEQGIELKG